MKFTLDEKRAVEIKVPENNIVIPNSITALPVSTSELGYVIGFLLFYSIDDETRQSVESRILSDDNLKSILTAILEVPQNKKTFKGLCKRLKNELIGKDEHPSADDAHTPSEQKSETVTEKYPEMFFFNRGGADASGYPITDTISGVIHFVVIAGSKLKSELTSSVRARTAAESIRRKLIEEGAVENLTFVKDYTFHTPSAAALAICGGSSNGWLEWKNKDGVPLDKLRKKAEPHSMPSDEAVIIEDVLDDLSATEKEFDNSVVNDLFFYKEKGSKATAHISVDHSKASIKITVHKGARIADSKSATGKAQRERLIQDGVLVKGKFSVDYTFDTPTEACMVLSATKGDVYLKWKNQDGVSLEDVRQYLLNAKSELM